MNGAEILVASLVREGVRVVFGYPGGAIMPVYDALLDAPIRHVLVRHEQAAAFAADGYARASGRVGVCIATSGPGATNLVTGIANAFCDSVPMVAVTGQVSTALMGTDAFQEVDVLGMTMPVVKHGFVVRDVADVATTMREAFRIAASGRPGPVLVDLPKDVATARADGVRWPDGAGMRTATAEPCADALARALVELDRAQRPIVYVGGGVGLGGAIEAFRTFVDAVRMPVVATLKGLGALRSDHELALGMIGMHGTRAANLAVQECDLLVCIGARFDDRATGKLEGFAPHARVVHLDVDPAEVGKLRRPEVAVIGDVVAALRHLARARPCPQPWRERCLARRGQPETRCASVDGVDGPALLRSLSAALDDEDVVACDVGQHQMWVAQHVGFARPDRHLTSGGLGAMGYGLPAAIGARFAEPRARVIVVTGDGSIMMNVQELATIRRYDLRVRILLLDNGMLGMVRQWQDCFFARRRSEVVLDDNPDFVRVAESFGIPARRLDYGSDVDAAIAALVEGDGPLLVHARIDPASDVWPLVPPGCDNATMIDEVPLCTSL